MRPIHVEPLTKAGFADFGDVVEWNVAAAISINQGSAERVNGLAGIDVADQGGAVNVALFAARARAYPLDIELMERHPLGSQLFVPMQNAPWLVLVCSDPEDPTTYCGFLASGRQGVNYAKGVWHHPLLVLCDGERFLVVDRAGTGDNLEEMRLGPGPKPRLELPSVKEDRSR